jgi:hypothetical protein
MLESTRYPFFISSLRLHHSSFPNMPTLSNVLPVNDLGFLRIVASLWGIELTSADAGEASVELAEALCDADLLEEVVSTLPQTGRAALEALIAEEGRMPWVNFARRFGDVREMGAGKRDREQPHLRPNSAAEMLYYRALLAKTFLETPNGLQEFAFIPDDLLEALGFIGFGEINNREDRRERDDERKEERISAPSANPVVNDFNMPLGRAASPVEKKIPALAPDRLLDDLTTLLAALRMNIEPKGLSIRKEVLVAFLAAGKLIEEKGEKFELSPNAVKSFFEMPRAQALEQLAEAWQKSESFNELRQLPGLSFEGAWMNVPLETREFLLDLLNAVPENQWWSMPAFVRDIKVKYADFQRPAGDYDSWFIKRESDGVFLRGFASWDEVDGALIRYFISGPLFWLGQVDLAAPEEGASPSAFRFIAQLETKEEKGKLTVSSSGMISIPRDAPRAVRYQIARFCEWDDIKNDEYRYRVTTASLKAAHAQSLKASQLLSLLAKHAAAPVPPAFIKALQRWEVNGTEARMESVTVLKVTRPEVLDELKKSKAARFLGEIIGPTTVVIQSGATSKILAALAELGLLAEVVQQDE